MTSPPPPPLDEFGLIARYLAPLAVHAGADGLRDDVAVLALSELAGDLVINTDAVVAGVHFLADEQPALIAERALRVNLSDLAAKGAKPLGYQLTLALNANQDEAWIAGFAEGLRANQDAFGWSLLGGDTVRTPGPLMISVTAFGTLVGGKLLRRGGAQVGDDVWVTGWIGDGALGLTLAQGRGPALPPDLARAAEQKFRLPEPRVAFGIALAEAGLATASADVSDGLIADLGHIAAASRLGIQIDAAAVPLSDAARAVVAQHSEWLDRLLSGGDDYEVVFTAPAAARARIMGIGERTKTPIHRIGATLADGADVTVRYPDGGARRLAHSGYRHF
jgi:thiamine-monophosphate kinase